MMLYFGSLNHAQDQGINGQTARLLLDDERTYGRCHEIDAIALPYSGGRGDEWCAWRRKQSPNTLLE